MAPSRSSQPGEPPLTTGRRQRPGRSGTARSARWSAARWLRQVRAFAVRYRRQYTRSPLSLAFLIAWPTFWYLLVVYVLFRTTPGGAERVAVAKAGLAVSFGLFGAFTVSLTGVVGSFTADVQTKRYRKFRSLPVSPSADLVGRYVAGTGLSMVSYAGLLVVGVLDGAAFTLRSPWSVGVIAVSVAGFTAVSVTVAMGVAALVPRPEYATTLATAVLMLTFFGTGFNGVSPALFPGPGWLLNVVPVTLVTRVQLYHLIDPATAGGAFGPPPLPADPGFLAAILAYAAGSLAVGALVMSHVVYVREAGE